MKINKLIALTTAVSMLLSVCGGGYNLIKAYASESTSTISIEVPAGVLSSYTGTGTYQNGKKYNIKTQPVDNSANGFTGWLLKDGDTYTDIAGIWDKSDFSFIANGSEIYTPTKNYNITYNLNGGTNSAQNPVGYDMRSTFTLKYPNPPVWKQFVGWTGSNGTTPEKDITITRGQTTGDKSYTANYENLEAVCTIKLTGVTFIEGITNIVAYDPNGNPNNYTNIKGNNIIIKCARGQKVVLYHNASYYWRYYDANIGRHHLGTGRAIYFIVPNNATGESNLSLFWNDDEEGKGNGVRVDDSYGWVRDNNVTIRLGE